MVKSGKQGSNEARRLQSLRKNRRGGRPKVLYTCEDCGLQFSAREFRTHPAQCKKTKAAKKSAKVKA
jgi:hypothetical protein